MSLSYANCCSRTSARKLIDPRLAGILNGYGTGLITGVGVGQTADVFQDLGDVTGDVNVDLSLGGIVKCTAVGNVAWSFTNLIPGKVNSVVLNIDKFAAFTQSLPGTAMWLGNSVPTNIPATARVVLVMDSYDNGSTWLVSVAWRSA